MFEGVSDFGWAAFLAGFFACYLITGLAIVSRIVRDVPAEERRITAIDLLVGALLVFLWPRILILAASLVKMGPISRDAAE